MYTPVTQLFMKRNNILLAVFITTTLALGVLFVRERTLYSELETKLSTDCVSRAEYDGLLYRTREADSRLQKVSVSLDSTRRIITRRDLLTIQNKRKNEAEISRLNSLSAAQLDSVLTSLKPHIE